MSLVAQLSLEPVFGWYAVVPLGIIMLASLWLTITTTGISMRGRLALMVLRLLAVLVLLLGWLRPGFISEFERESPGAIAVLLDRTESMTLPSGESSKSRWQVQQEVWSAIESSTNLSMGETKIVPFFYDSEPQAATADDLPALEQSFANKPSGRITDLGNTLAKIGRLQLDPPLRGVILVGDATQTQIPPEVDASTAARQMARLDQPIMVVGIGPKPEKSQLRDVAIEGLQEQYSAFAKKEVNIKFTVHIQGMQNQPVTVALKLNANGKEQFLASRQVRATRPNEKLPLEFKVTVQEEGEYLLEALAQTDNSTKEQIKTNNRMNSFITVRDGGAKLLYLYGEPRPEQTFLKRALEESLDFDVQYFWFQERFRNRWPLETASGNVRFDEFDVIILGDLDIAALSRKTQQGILRRINSGGGLLLLGGYHSFDAGGYGRTRNGVSILEPLFPIRMRQTRQQFDALVNTDFHLPGPIQLQQTRPDEITRIFSEPENTELWRSLSLEGANRFGQLKSGATTILESSRGAPIMVKGFAQQGRVVAFAGDSTWRWSLSGKRKVHQQFWRQSILWLIGRDSLSEGFKLDLDRRRLLIDETPDLTISWFGGSKEKPMPENVRIKLMRNGQLLQNLTATETGPNSKTSKIAGLDQPGLYFATLEASGDDGSQYETNVAFVVRDESRELANPAADWRMMQNIVSSNQAAGAQLFYPENVGEALQWFRDRQATTRVTTIEKRRLGDAAWDAWVYLVIFCALMSAEWALRKSWQLP